MSAITFEEKQNLNKLSQAIKSRSVVRFKYKEEKRIVEPFLVGIRKDSEKLTVRCWCKKAKDWRQYILSEMTIITITNDLFDPSKRKGYNKNDSEMSKIIDRIE